MQAFLQRRAQMVVSPQFAAFGTRVAHYNPVAKEKDYYQILGISNTATLE